MWEPLAFAELTLWDEYNEDGVVSKTMNDTIREQREKLHQLPQKYVPFLTGLRNNIQRIVNERMSKPYHKVFRVHHQRMIREIDERIEELKQKKDLTDFEVNIQPFIIAHAAMASEVAQQESEAGEDGLANHVERLKVLVAKGAGAPLKNSPGELQTDVVRSMIGHLWGSQTSPGPKMTTRMDVCERCSVPMTKSVREQRLICSKCGVSRMYLDTTEASRTYGDDVEFTVNTSHRYNHWQEFVTRSQAREVKAVPKNILTRVALYLRDHMNVTRSQDITLSHVFTTVNSLNLKDYKKNIVQIHARLTGRWPKQLTAEQMFVAKAMFFEILNAFERLFPDEKWFRNKFCMAVICHTMGWDDLIESFSFSTVDALTSRSEPSASPVASASASPPAAASASASASPPAAASASASASPPASHAGQLPPKVSPFQAMLMHDTEESEIRMRKIFDSLGWAYRGPIVNQVHDRGLGE